MVNLRAIANRYTSTINPNVTVQRHAYAGRVRSPSGKVKATYADPVPLVAQFQALSKKDVEHLDNMNLSTCERAAFVNGQLVAFDRAEQTGGDIIVGDGAVWMVMAILAGWTQSGWCKVALTKQNGMPE